MTFHPQNEHIAKSERIVYSEYMTNMKGGAQYENRCHGSMDDFYEVK